MGNELEVNADDLRAAAAGSDWVAATLAGVAAEGPTGAQPSAAGVAALDSAISATRARQSARVSGQASDVSVAGARYDDTDAGGAEDVSVSM